ARRRAAERHRPAVRLLLPHPLPDRQTGLRRGRPAAPPPARRPFGGLSFSRAVLRVIKNRGRIDHACPQEPNIWLDPTGEMREIISITNARGLEPRVLFMALRRPEACSAGSCRSRSSAARP